MKFYLIILFVILTVSLQVLAASPTKRNKKEQVKDSTQTPDVKEWIKCLEHMTDKWKIAGNGDKFDFSVLAKGIMETPCNGVVQFIQESFGIKLGDLTKLSKMFQFGKS